MQAVVLAGGRGTRLGHLTDGLPKPLVSVQGKPFLDYQVALLKECGFTDLVFCVGHGADAIMTHLGDDSRHGVRVRFSVERGELLGTAGAVKQAEPLLWDTFFLTYFDAYLRLDYCAVLQALMRAGTLGVMVVYRNEDRYERSNVAVAKGFVRAYDKEQRAPGMVYVNFGVSALRREALAFVPAGVPYSQEAWFQSLIRRRQLAAFETAQRFYEVGSPPGLWEFRRLAAEGALP